MRPIFAIAGLLVFAGAYESLAGDFSTPRHPIVAMQLPPNPGGAVAPGTPPQVFAKALPASPARMAALRQKYRDDAGFRRLVSQYNTETGHPDRGETASLQAIDAQAVAGGPVFALIRAFQPQATIARGIENRWMNQPGSTTP